MKATSKAAMSSTILKPLTKPELRNDQARSNECIPKIVVSHNKTHAAVETTPPSIAMTTSHCEGVEPREDQSPEEGKGHPNQDKNEDRQTN